MKKRTVEIVDDITGQPAKATRKFTINNVQYSIDLSEESAAEFDRAFERYTAHASGKKRLRASSSSRGVKLSATSNTAIRNWAKANNVTVSTRGRISNDVRRQFRAAQRKPKVK
jgi:hypothetical protein